MIKVIGNLWQIKAETTGKGFGDSVIQLHFRDSGSREQGTKPILTDNSNDLDVMGIFPIFFYEVMFSVSKYQPLCGRCQRGVL